MNKLILLIITISIIMTLILGCSTDKSPLPSNAHPQNWLASSDKEGHGAKVLAVGLPEGLASCASCHGKDFNGGESGVSCYRCHASFPHSAQWDERGSALFHGAYLSKSKFDHRECTLCHSEVLAEQDVVPACHSCHALYPHDSQWLNIRNAQFHGTFVKNQNWQLTACIGCHGADFQGGGNKSSCYACHPSYPHLDGWNDPGNKSYHGYYLAASEYNLNGCKPCHGENFQGGDGKASCYACHDTYPHAAGWENPNNKSYHGYYLQTISFDLHKCAACHGADYLGKGVVDKSCYNCHSAYPHAMGWEHRDYLRAHGHNLKECQACHAADYKGGDTGVNCLMCHFAEGGPERCNLCHGNENNNAPPKDTKGNTAETAIGVGKHQYHVWTLNYACGVCHQMPTNFASAGHVYEDTTPGRAEILAFWQYNHNTATCVTACHANPNKTYIWNQ